VEDSKKALFAHISERFLHSVKIDGFKFMITLETRNVLLELVEAYWSLVLESLPDLVPSSSTSSGSEASADADASAGRAASGLPELNTRPLEGSDAPDVRAASETSTSVQQPRGPATSQDSRLLSRKSFAERGRRPSLSDVALRNLFSLEFNRTQIQLLDEAHKGCIVLTIDYACMQGRVGSDGKVELVHTGKEPKLTENDLENATLQRLAQRSLVDYTESVMLNVNAMMVFVAPTDIDIGVGLLWLPDSAFLCMRGNAGRGDEAGAGTGATFGLLRPILDPLPVELDILAIHERSLHHVVRLQMPDIALSFDSEQCHLFRNVLECIAISPLPKVEERANQVKIRRLREQLSAAAGGKYRTLSELRQAKRGANWRSKALRGTMTLVREALQLKAESGEHGSAAESRWLRGVSDTAETYRSLDAFACSHFNLSLGGVAFEDFMNAWLLDIEDKVVHNENERQMITEYLQSYYADLRRDRAKPNTQLEWRVEGFSIKLKQMQRLFCTASVYVLKGSYLSFEDESAELDFDISSIKVDDMRSASTIVFPATQKRGARMTDDLPR
jgi:hypothetical protein